jgi:hypothetical protein
MVFLGVVAVFVRSPPVGAYTSFHACFCLDRQNMHPNQTGTSIVSL